MKAGVFARGMRCGHKLFHWVVRLLCQLVNLHDYIVMRMRTSESAIIRKSFEARIIEFNFPNCQLLFGAKCN